jgi:hypothetical protein
VVKITDIGVTGIEGELGAVFFFQSERAVNDLPVNADHFAVGEAVAEALFAGRLGVENGHGGVIGQTGSLCFHVVLPILYIADWFLFRERRKSQWYYPIASIAFPLAYVIFLLIQAVILKFDSSILIPTTTTPLIYPYFFVNLDTQGVSGVLMWIGILSVAFAAVGFAFFGLDRLGKRRSK